LESLLSSADIFPSSNEVAARANLRRVGGLGRYKKVKQVAMSYECKYGFWLSMANQMLQAELQHATSSINILTYLIAVD